VYALSRVDPKNSRKKSSLSAHQHKRRKREMGEQEGPTSVTTIRGGSRERWVTLAPEIEGKKRQGTGGLEKNFYYERTAEKGEPCGLPFKPSVS